MAAHSLHASIGHSAKKSVERPVIVLVATRKRLAHVTHFKIMKKAPPPTQGRQSSCTLQ
ncbi:MAG: hypothetical protein G3W66_05915 [Xanthomonas perforans]|nr:hypothetical protein [Xanthomonas perforans]